MSKRDTTHRFLFDETDIRGEIVTLENSFQQAVSHQNLSPGLKSLLGEFLSAAALLSESMKFQGVLTLQARGDGDVPLIMAEATHDGFIRGIVKPGSNDDYQDKPSLRHVLNNAILTLTIDPLKGERYQGIIPLEHSHLAECLTQYFMLSEQLPSQLWLFSLPDKCGGLMIQSMPPQKIPDEEQRKDTWETLTSLAGTITGEELFSLEHETLLFRLFNEMNCRLFPARNIEYRCSCSKERCANAILSLGKDEAMSIVTEQQAIEMDCQFCGQHYAFNGDAVSKLFTEQDNNIVH